MSFEMTSKVYPKDTLLVLNKCATYVLMDVKKM